MSKLTLSGCLIIAVLLPVQCQYVGDSCFDEEQAGTCKRLTDCQPLLDEVIRAGNPMPIRMRKRLQKLTCGYDRNNPIVCCVPPASNNGAGWQVNPLDRPVDNNPGGTESRIGQPPDIDTHPNLRLLPTACGSFESDRIIGGNRTRLFELPWMVLLSYDTARGKKLSCGGTLISQWYVLTAAHCVSFLGERLQLGGVVLGEYDVRTDPDCETIENQKFCAPDVQTVGIDEVIAHPGYSPQTLVDDIALLRLSQPANFSLDSMKPVCLPINSKLQNENLEGVQGTVAGWGATEDGLQSPVLLSVDLPIVPNEECVKAYKGTPKIHERQICAGGVVDQDSCAGDSGGPLMYVGSFMRSARFVQRGIVSFGSKRCGIGGFPGVYTRIAYYMDWILDNLRE